MPYRWLHDASGAGGRWRRRRRQRVPRIPGRNKFVEQYQRTDRNPIRSSLGATHQRSETLRHEPSSLEAPRPARRRRARRAGRLSVEETKTHARTSHARIDRSASFKPQGSLAPMSENTAMVVAHLHRSWRRAGDPSCSHRGVRVCFPALLRILLSTASSTASQRAACAVSERTVHCRPRTLELVDARRSDGRAAARRLGRLGWHARAVPADHRRQPRHQRRSIGGVWPSWPPSRRLRLERRHTPVAAH